VPGIVAEVATEIVPGLVLRMSRSGSCDLV
jgi:hypothetical protein